MENATSYDIYADGTLIGNTTGGNSVEYKLTFSQMASVTVNGNNVESGYILKNGDVIIAKNLYDDLGVNPPKIVVSEGTETQVSYISTQTISLSNRNVHMFSDPNSWGQITLTINFSIT